MKTAAQIIAEVEERQRKEQEMRLAQQTKAKRIAEAQSRGFISDEEAKALGDEPIDIVDRSLESARRRFFQTHFGVNVDSVNRPAPVTAKDETISNLPVRSKPYRKAYYI